MASHTIGVFPASGGIGGSTVKHLLPRFPAKDLVFVARNPANLDFASAAGATVRQANYDDDKSLEHAFDGVETLFLISYPSVEFEHRAEVSLRCFRRVPSMGEMTTNLEFTAPQGGDQLCSSQWSEVHFLRVPGLRRVYWQRSQQ